MASITRTLGVKGYKLIMDTAVSKADICERINISKYGLHHIQTTSTGSKTSIKQYGLLLF